MNDATTACNTGAPRKMGLTVDHVKKCCHPEMVAKLDAAGFNWQGLLQILETLAPLIISLFTQPQPTPAPVVPPAPVS